VLARKIEDVVGEPERHLIEREVGERNALGENNLAVAVLAVQARGVVGLNAQHPDLKCLRRDRLGAQLNQGDFIQQPIGPALSARYLTPSV
jgi:hypothetical protein